jgi:UDP-N-acetylmuramyl pentapeptide synthase
MDLLFVVTSSAFFLWVVRNILFWIWLLQRNDYQLSRVRNYFSKTIQGRKVWLSYILIIKVLIVIAFVPTVFDETLITPYHFIVAAIFIIDAIIFFKELATNSLKLPNISPIVAYFILPALFIIALFYYNPIIDPYLWFLLLDRLLVVIILLLLFALSFPLEIYWDFQIQMAKRKMQALQHCYVVAVIGGGEKKMTAAMIGQIFGDEQGLLTFYDGTTTQRSLADGINKSVTDATRMIIVSFESFGKNDLYELSQLLMPNVIVCTTIQHEKTAFYEEFFRTLPESVPVVLNTTYTQNQHLHKYLLAKSKKKYRRIVAYTADPQKVDKSVRDSVRLTGATYKKLLTSFTSSMNGKSQHFSTLLLGRYSVMCLLPAVYLGMTSGTSYAEMKTIIANLQPPEGHMVPYVLQNNAVIIDNTAVEDRDAIESCVAYANLFRGRKVLIYSPSPVLLRQAAEQQSAIGAMIAVYFDHLFVVNKYFHRAIMKGFYKTNSKCVITYKNKYKIANYLKKNLQQKDDVVVFSGRSTQKILQHVLKRVH